MFLIAHRGLTKGPNKELENRPETIIQTLEIGFDAEIDVWYVDNKWFLGHDEPTYEVDYQFLKQNGLWLHCKNIDAVAMLSAQFEDKLNYFWHQEDHITLTSHKWIWTYPDMQLTGFSIWVQPEWNGDWQNNIQNQKSNYAGICSKYVFEIKELLGI